MKPVPLSRAPRVEPGFTLIELLTVIAIIGILASILIPVVGRVRESARAATVASNLRQIHAGAMLWSGDNKNRIMPAKGAALGSAYDWYWYGRKYSSDANRYETPLALYMNMSVKDWAALNKITISPSNLTDTSIPTTSAYGYPYMVNYQVMVHGDGAGGASKTPLPFSSLKAPSRIVMLADSFATDELWAMGRALLESFQSRMATPYGGKGHVLWADGHVTRERPADLTVEMIVP